MWRSGTSRRDGRSCGNPAPLGNYRGGANFTYRIEVAPTKPEVAVWFPEMQQNTQERQTISVPIDTIPEGYEYVHAGEFVQRLVRLAP